LYKELLAISFDEEFASIVGVPVNQLYLLILCLAALTVVVLIRIVGVILVIALLTIPAAISEQYTHNMKKIMFYAVILGAFFTFTGLWFSYIFDLPSGATIILISGIGFFTASLLRTMRNRNFVISSKS
jgi:zinc transport system permease protein